MSPQPCAGPNPVALSVLHRVGDRQTHIGSIERPVSGRSGRTVAPAVQPFAATLPVDRIHHWSVRRGSVSDTDGAELDAGRRPARSSPHGVPRVPSARHRRAAAVPATRAVRPRSTRRPRRVAALRHSPPVPASAVANFSRRTTVPAGDHR